MDVFGLSGNCCLSGTDYNAGMDDTDTSTVAPLASERSDTETRPAAPATSPAERAAPVTAPEALAGTLGTPAPVGPPLSELEFIGCKTVPMTYAQFRRYEGRLEVWDAESETAWMVREPTSPTHESPSHGLAGLVERIAAVRGSPVSCYGSMDLLVRDAHGKHGERGSPRRIMQADQTVYLHPSRAELLGADAMVVGMHNYPDVVLEVDHTTDVRRGKLKLYEAWGFPELWVEVPDVRAPSRPKGRLPGLTIHLLEGGVYRESPESLAFPGWRAEDVHEALNEVGRSARTNAILERLGRGLGAGEGTGPDDDPLMRSLRSQSRAEGRAEGLAEGEAKGRAEMVRQMLSARGIEVSERFPADVPGFAESPRAAVVVASLACESERDFRARIPRLRRH